MNMNAISGKDISESYPMLESGRAIAFMQGDALLAGEMAKAKKPEDWATGPPRNPTNSMVVQCVGVIRISRGCLLRHDLGISARFHPEPAVLWG